MRTKKNIIRPLVLFMAFSLTAGLLLNPASAQQQGVCINDTVKVYIDEYRGERSWQKSLNGSDWSYMEAAGDTISVVAAEPFFIRLEVVEGSCLPFYSEILSVEINDPPIVEFELRDTACINDRDFELTGGFPSGGIYTGPGVIGNRFNPGDAGIGIHGISYFYTDPQTGCSGSGFAQIEVFPVTSEADAGEDALLIPSDSVQLTALTPDYGTGSWTIITGTGGFISDPGDPGAWFRKDSSGLDYVLRWTVEGPCGTDYDDVTLNFMELGINPCPGTPYVVDEDGNIYKTVQVGSQCWMAENLRTGTYVPSTSTNLHHSNLADNGIIEKYCFDNDTANCTLYGGLYDWHEAMGYSEQQGVQGVCPEGWHLPTNNDWENLDSQFKYGDAGEQLKQDRYTGWEGQFAGDRHSMGEFYSFGSSGFFWSSTTYEYRDINEGYLRQICACNGALDEGHFNKLTGLSVRCIKDE